MELTEEQEQRVSELEEELVGDVGGGNFDEHGGLLGYYDRQCCEEGQE